MIEKIFKSKNMYICIDFDGTCVAHEYPRVGKDIGAVPVLKKIVELGHKLILFTMRDGQQLEDAVEWFYRNGIELHGIQENPTQHSWTTSPKAYGQIYIDDAALGAPLKIDKSISCRPFIDWRKAEEMLGIKTNEPEEHIISKI